MKKLNQIITVVLGLLCFVYIEVLLINFVLTVLVPILVVAIPLICLFALCDVVLTTTRIIYPYKALQAPSI